MRIYVGNLPYGLREDDLMTFFEAFGTVESTAIIYDRDTGRSKGFGFVEMPNDAEGQAACDELNGKDIEGRPLTVNEARPREEGGGGGRRGGGGGGGRGRY